MHDFTRAALASRVASALRASARKSPARFSPKQTRPPICNSRRRLTKPLRSSICSRLWLTLVPSRCLAVETESILFLYASDDQRRQGAQDAVAQASEDQQRRH